KARKPIGVFEAASGGGRVIIDKNVRILQPAPAPKPSPAGNSSPDGKRTVALKDANVVLRENASGKEFTLTKDGTGNDGYFDDVFWSKDSTRFVALRTVKVKERQISIV